MLGFVTGAAHRGLVDLRAGRLALVEADLQASLELANQHHMRFALPFITAYLATTLLERGRLDDAAELVEGMVLDTENAMAAAAAVFLHARANVRPRSRTACGAAADFRDCGELCQAIAIHSHTAVAWRSPLALLLARQDPDEAQHLVSAELEDAHRAGIARGIGVALHAAGLLTSGDNTVELLRRSINVLNGSPATLELHPGHIWTWAPPSPARMGHRMEARQALRIAADLAYRSGADRLIAQWRTEILTAGGRPRRLAVTGVEALTPAELRVVRLATQEMTNRQIAQSLFITTKTVKDHLGSAYRKLDIASRTELPNAMLDQPEAQTPQG